MQLNYHHLRIFWAIARTGSLRAAGEELKLSQPTLSSQLRELEGSLGSPLFTRAGRRLLLTAEGRIALGYAEEIFSLGSELRHALDRRDTSRVRRLNVGIVQSLPKLVARELLRPALLLDPPVRLICHEGSLEVLVERLANFHLDVILADEPLSGGSQRRMFNHRLGATGMIFVGVPAHARQYARDYPASLHGAPVLMPTEASPLRRALESWFQGHGIRPRVVAEFDDSALMKDFAAEGIGMAPIFAAAEKQSRQLYGLKRVGPIEGLRTDFYAISAERRLRDGAVLAITEQAQAIF